MSYTQTRTLIAMLELERQGLSIRMASQIGREADCHVYNALQYLAWDGYVDRLEPMFDRYWRWRLTEKGRQAARSAEDYQWVTDSEVT